ncbi:MAG TPA: hypothetical protein VNY51_13245 [Candidatus Dormibacteraeota bacterium]|jgi:hypothetical protein|nr:hypothetical protein [Candidatus Dormibacteraeota bacterium]
MISRDLELLEADVVVAVESSDANEKPFESRQTSDDANSQRNVPD